VLTNNKVATNYDTELSDVITQALEMKGDKGIIHLENSMDGITSNIVK
jgi:hypothetical protein